MGKFLLTATNEVTFSTNSPTAAQIEGALQAIPIVAARADRVARGLPDDGGWVGSARITRRANALPPGGRLTDVAWLYSWPDRTPASAEASAASEITAYILSKAREATFDQPAALPESAGWRNIAIVPYDPAVNGSLEWWQSGEASRTVTRDAFDLNQQLGSNATRDNPTGPTTTHAPDFNPSGTNDPNSATSKFIGLATTALWAAGGIALMVYVVGPLVGAVLSPSKSARVNPGRRRLTKFQEAYLDAAMATSMDDGGRPLDRNYGPGDIAESSYNQMLRQASKFEYEHAEDIGDDDAHAGRDFWHTRNGHGAGFWDGDWPKEAGERLTKAAKEYGEQTLYVGDDGVIHVYPPPGN